MSESEESNRSAARSHQVWREEALQIAAQPLAPDELCQALANAHPRGRGTTIGPTFFALLERRGRDVTPYVISHLTSVGRSWTRGEDGYRDLLALASDKGWLDLWGAILRTCAAPVEFNKALQNLLSDASLSTDEVQQHLRQLTTVAPVENTAKQGEVQPLTDAAAAQLYDSFPELLHEFFLRNLAGDPATLRPKLTQLALQQDDPTLIDLLAGQIVTSPRFSFPARQFDAVVDRLTDYYARQTASPTEFIPRLVEVLLHAPRSRTASLARICRENRLAQLLYGTQISLLLDYPAKVLKLLHAKNHCSRQLGWKALGCSDPRADLLFHENLNIVTEAIRYPDDAKIQRLAMAAACAHAATTAKSAKTLVMSCREALRSPVLAKERDSLLGLLALLVHQFPEFRLPRNMGSFLRMPGAKSWRSPHRQRRRDSTG